MLKAICSFALLFCVANAQPRCGDAAMVAAERDAVRIRSWDSAFRWVKLYGTCAFVAADEGFSDSVGRLLVEHWSNLTRAAALIRKNPDFRPFVCGGRE